MNFLSSPLRGPATKPQELTDLAKKYTHPTGPDHVVISHYEPFMSGLTPLEPGPFASVVDRDVYKDLRDYQIERFRGYTTSGIVAAGAFAPYEPEDNPYPTFSGLDGIISHPLHPMLEKGKWELPLPLNLAPVPFENGPEYWDTTNARVWKGLKPALHLISLILSKAHTWSWFDALFFAPVGRIPQREIPKSHQRKRFFRFRQRTPQEVQASKYKLLKLLEQYGEKMMFRFHDGRMDAITGMEDDQSSFLCGSTAYGFCRRDHPIMISVAYQYVQPLLRTDLTDGERLTDTFRLAATILHEMGHAFNLLRTPTRYLKEAEPYFNDEAITEIGFSLENAVFGGVCKSLVGEGRFDIAAGLSSGVIIQTNWNSIYNSFYDDKPTLLSHSNGLDWEVREQYPVGIPYFQDLFSVAYWESHTRIYGAESLHMGPKNYGVYHQAPLNMKSLADPSQITHATLRYEQEATLPWNRGMSRTETDALNRENERRARAFVISQRIRRHTKEHKAFDIDPTLSPRWLPRLTRKRFVPEPGPDTRCPRFDIIRNYLEQHRQVLAFDTLVTYMPIDTIGQYVIRNGAFPGDSLTAGEWRNFIHQCARRKILFEKPDDKDYITRSPAGWSAAPVGLPVPPPRPSKVKQDMFDRIADKWIDEVAYWVDLINDHPKDDLLYGIGVIDQISGIRVSGASKVFPKEPTLAELDALVFYCRFFSHAPPGLLRIVDDPDPGLASREKKGRPSKLHFKDCYPS